MLPDGSTRRRLPELGGGWSDLENHRVIQPPLVLYIPDSATEREIHRAGILSRSLGAQIHGIAGIARTARHDALLADQPRQFVSLSGGPGAVGEGPLISVSNELPLELKDWWSDVPVWVFVEGDPRDAFRGSISQAIRAEERRVGISLCQLNGGSVRLQPLAFQDVPRRPWDSQRVLERRLDQFLPQLVEDGGRALENGAGAAEAISPLSLIPRSPRFNPTERAKDAKFFIGLICTTLASLLIPSRDTRIVMFHNPVPDILDQNLRALARRGPFLSYSRTVEAVLAKKETPPGTVVTFDDGFKQNMALLNVLERHRCSAMFFISTAPVDNDSTLWFMDPDREFRSRKNELSSLPYDGFLKAIAAYGFTEPSALRGRLGLQSEEIREIVARGHEVGLHSHNHPFLTRLTESEVFHELDLCRQVLSAAVGKAHSTWDVAYPEGEYDSGIFSVLDEIGARSACSTLPGTLAAGVDRYALPRYVLDDADYPGFVLFKLTPFYRAMKIWQGQIRTILRKAGASVERIGQEQGDADEIQLPVNRAKNSNTSVTERLG